MPEPLCYIAAKRLRIRTAVIYDKPVPDMDISFYNCKKMKTIVKYEQKDEKMQKSRK